MPSGGDRPGGESEWRPETRMTSDERIELVRSGLEQWSEGFLAYLLLPNVDLSDRHLPEHFLDCYAGWYPDRHAFAEGQIAALGWKDALTEFRVERGIPDGALDLDWDQIWEHCCEVYDIVERLGGVHVFMR